MCNIRDHHGSHSFMTFLCDSQVWVGCLFRQLGWVTERLGWLCGWLLWLTVWMGLQAKHFVLPLVKWGWLFGWVRGLCGLWAVRNTQAELTIMHRTIRFRCYVSFPLWVCKGQERKYIYSNIGLMNNFEADLHFMLFLFLLYKSLYGDIALFTPLLFITTFPFIWQLWRL